MPPALHDPLPTGDGAGAIALPLLPLADALVAAGCRAVPNLLGGVRLAHAAATGRVHRDDTRAHSILRAGGTIAPLRPLAPNAVRGHTLIFAALCQAGGELLKASLAFLSAGAGLSDQLAGPRLLPAAAGLVTRTPVGPFPEHAIHGLRFALHARGLAGLGLVDRALAEGPVAAAVVLDAALPALSAVALRAAGAPSGPIIQLAVQGGDARDVLVAASLLLLRAQGWVAAGRCHMRHLAGALRHAAGAALGAGGPLRPVAPLAVLAAALAMPLQAGLHFRCRLRLAGLAILRGVLGDVPVPRPRAEAAAGAAAAPGAPVRPGAVHLLFTRLGVRHLAAAGGLLEGPAEAGALLGTGHLSLPHLVPDAAGGGAAGPAGPCAHLRVLRLAGLDNAAFGLNQGNWARLAVVHRVLRHLSVPL
mmetsp:Transcript_70544/g.168443  ORF Transcript_70544/g.168443 Transcript_70544/m.168443 type:complete len:419 (-) Transcript_70544:575-1831(-)